MRIWQRKIKRMVYASLMLMTAFGMVSCAELRSEFDPHKWRYQPYPTDMPPSWENDMGRPGPEDSGDDMFEDTW